MNKPTDTPEKQQCSSFVIKPIDAEKGGAIDGYFVRSTAPINVEDPPRKGEDPSAGIQALAQRLLETDDSEITISVHGYGTNPEDAKVRYRKILNYANSLYEGEDTNNSVFMGYLWPSEPVNSSVWLGFKGGLQSLPTLLTILLAASVATLLGNFSFLIFHSFIVSLIVFVGVSLLIQFLADTLEIISSNPLSLISVVLAGITLYGLILLGLDSSFSLKIWVWAIASSVTAIVFGVILALLLLRLANYLRDSYRASNYAVTDLVDLAQLLDYQLAEIAKNDPNKATKRIQLNFIAHSMGCFVTTNVIRVVSDAFHDSSSYQLGKHLALGRLILVAPDISIQTIMPGRSNLFSYALKKFKETYVFSNEGDLALRVASTAVNYIRFPARTRFMGYRLGCITAKHFEDKRDKTNTPNVSEYGIINLSDPKHPTTATLMLPHEKLSVRASNQEHRSLLELEPEADGPSPFMRTSVVNAFTYFDCTDYKDVKIKYVSPTDDTGSDTSDTQNREAQGQSKLKEVEPEVGIVSNAVKKKALGLKEYIRLALDYFVPAGTLGSRGINTHGGFFNGNLSFKLITGLAFIGFQDCCQRLDQVSGSSEITKLHDACQKKGIQVVISPKRIPEEEG